MVAVTLTENLDSLWTSTWPAFKPGVIDVIFLKRNPMFFWLSQKGHIQYVSGGRDIRYPLEVDINPTVTEIGKTGQVSLADSDPFTTVIWQWGTIAGNVNRYRSDDLANRGEASVFNLMQGKRKNLVKSMHKKFEQDSFRTKGTRPAGGIHSLRDLIDVTPTVSTTVGNFDQSVRDWWRNQTRTATGAAAVMGRKDMQQLVFDLEDVESTPDLIMCHRNFYGTYEDDLLEMTIFENKKLADASFKHLVYGGIPMLKSTECPSTELLMLNSDFIYLVVDPAMNFEMTQWKEVINEPFNRVAQIVVQCQLLTTHRGAQGVLHTLTY